MNIWQWINISIVDMEMIYVPFLSACVVFLISSIVKYIIGKLILAKYDSKFDFFLEKIIKLFNDYFPRSSNVDPISDNKDNPAR